MSRSPNLQTALTEFAPLIIAISSATATAVRAAGVEEDRLVVLRLSVAPPEDMEDLGSARGSQFDSMWLEMMVEHHDGAISMAQTQVADGLHPEAVALAENIAESQEVEIDEMKALLQGTTG